MKDIDSFLQGQQAGLIDSTGQFTIAADKALKKLAHSQLPDPSYWVLKVAQFATAFGVSDMRVVVGRRILRIDIGLPKAIGLTKLQAGLGTASPLENPPLDHLVTGLRALGAIEGRRFALELRDLEVCESLFWDGQKLTARAQSEKSNERSLALEVTYSTPSAWKALMDKVGTKRRAAESKALSSKGFTVPFNLRLDGSGMDCFLAKTPDCFSQSLLWDYSTDENGTGIPGFLKKTGGHYPKVSAFWQVSYNYHLVHKTLRMSPEPKGIFRLSSLN